MTKTVILKHRTYSGNSYHPRKETLPEEVYEQICAQYKTIDSLVARCIDIRKFIRVASRRPLINSVDKELVKRADYMLANTETALFRKAEEEGMQVFEVESTPGVFSTCTDSELIIKSNMGFILYHKKFVYKKKNAFEIQRRMDSATREAQVVFESLSDGYY